MRKKMALLLISILLFSFTTAAFAYYEEECIPAGSGISYEKHKKVENTDEIDNSAFYADFDKILKEAEKEATIHSHIDLYDIEKEEMTPKHFSIYDHTHHAYYTGNTDWIHIIYLTAFCENLYYVNPSTWPTIAYSIGQSFTKSASWSTDIGVSSSTISASLGFNVTASSTVTASTTYTFSIPYMMKGRIKCTSDFKKYSYYLETKYYQFFPPNEYYYWYSNYSYNHIADGPLYNNTFGIQLLSLG